MEVERLLLDLLPALEQLALPSELGLDPALEEAEAVHVLELGLRRRAPPNPAGRIEMLPSTRRLPSSMFTSETPSWRIVVAEQLRPLARLGRGADVGLGDDLDQRGAAAVEVDQRGSGAVDPARLADVGQLRRVLLQVGAVDADVAELAVHRDRLVVLADLVALRQVGIEVVLAGELGAVGRPRTRAPRRSSARSGSPARSSSAASPGGRGRPGRCGRWARRRRRARSRRTSSSWSRAGRGSPARSRPRSRHQSPQPSRSPRPPK